MRFSCQFDYTPQPAEPDEFICPMIVDVICYCEHHHEVVAAKLAVDHLDITRASIAGERVYDVCDADSAGWASVYAALFEPDSDLNDPELRRDFEFDELVTDLLFIYKSVFHPCLRKWQSFIIHHVSELVGDLSATVMWKSETSLSKAELAKLGFRMIAGQDLLFRPNMFEHEYSPDAESNTDDLVVPDDADAYVLNEREKKEHPPSHSR